MEENYQNAYKYLMEPLRSGRAGGGGREAHRRAPAPAAKANITLLTWKMRMNACVYQCVSIARVCVCRPAW